MILSDHVAEQLHRLFDFSPPDSQPILSEKKATKPWNAIRTFLHTGRQYRSVTSSLLIDLFCYETPPVAQGYAFCAVAK